MKIAPRLFLALAAACLSLGPVPASAGNPPAWSQPFAPFRVIDRIYYVGSAGISAWLIATPKGLILLDAGMPDYAPQVEANIRKLGFRLGDVKILLNSHAHFDHSGGLARIKADTGARLIAATADRKALETGTYPGWEARHDLDAPPVKVDSTIADGGTVELGGVRLTAMITPGHSAGCTNWRMTVRDGATPRSVFFFCSATVAANRLVPDPQYPGIVADYRRSLARLRMVKADVFLAPHAEFFDLAGKRARMAPGKPNPFVDPSEVQPLMAKLDAAFVKELARQEAAARK